MSDNHKYAETSDEKLITATLKGDTSCFGAIVERYWAMAVALALSKIDDPIEAEDIAQDSFIKAYSQLHTLRKPSRFAGWLSTIIAQQCTNLFRQKARRKTAWSSEMGTPAASGAAFACSTNPTLSAEHVHLVRRTVRRLPEKLRNLIIMKFVAGLSAREIARQLGKRHGAVRVALHRAYQILRKDLAPLLEEAEQ